MYLGIDIWSVSIKYAVVDDDFQIIENDYFRTHWDLLTATKKLLKKIKTKEFNSVWITGSGRKFLSALLSADYDVDEITAHRKAVSIFHPEVNTIFEIGWQDSKLINITGDLVDFEMNNVCAAGTGSFIDQQASRLSMWIEEFYKKWLETDESYEIASKCTVFAETDMIHAQQSGIPINKIIRWVHKWMINNYFSQMCRWKQLVWKFLFEWWASENKLLLEEFKLKLLEENLIKNEKDLITSKYNKVLGAIWAAIFWKLKNISNNRSIPEINDFEFVKTGKCFECATKCGSKVITFKINNKLIKTWKVCQQ